MKLITRILIAIALSAAVDAQEFNGTEITERAFVADTAAVEPGKPFAAGFHFKIAEHWHAYWRYPGGIGTPFTVAKWNLPAGWKADPIEFPLPAQITDQYGSTFYGYEHEVFFFVKLTPPAKLEAGSVTLGADVEWQVCYETCVQGKASMTLTLPVGAAAPANAVLFTKWREQLPQISPPPTEDVKFEFAGQELTVRVGGLPKDVKAEFFVIAPRKFDRTFEFEKKLVTETAPDGSRVFKYPFDGALDWSGLLVMTGADGVRKGWYIGDPPPVEGPERRPAEAGVEDDGETWDPFAELSANEKQGDGLWALLLQGFIGGLLLNLMPCVLPVLSLKILGFVQQAGESKERVFRLGLSFCTGVFAFFLGLALLVLGLASTNKTLGWGAQFSNPIALTVMVSILFLFALSLLGVFEITLGGAESKLSEASSRGGYRGAFVHGFFTTLLGTSCTAPFIGPVLGTAINEPGSRIFALFSAIAAGLSLPYFLLAWKPAWMKFLPKPGTWMIRMKQFFGFVMLGFAVWLLGSLPSVAAVISVSGFLLVVAFAAWLYGSYHDARWPLFAAVVLIAGGWVMFVRGSIERPAASGGSGLLTAVRKGLNEGRPVFVDFTADWCLNCKAFEKLVLDTQPIQEAFKAKNVHFVKADYTTEPPDIAAALKKLKRSGVPVYVLFRKRGDAWIADGLTQGALLDELNKL
jgi:DsbC/DsbD-like thiol-disulfide interchange protein/cytochrome c biogenesis protein CcdA/thiol-disulfide isomerase/thioredoxin